MGTFSSETSANSGKFETLIALQNDPRWLFLHTWFSNFPRGSPPPPPPLPPDHPTRRVTWGNFGSHSSIQPLPHAATPPPSYTDTKKLLFSRHLPMSRTTSPAPFFFYITSASDWIRLLLCKGKFPALFAGSGKFY